MTTPGSPPDDPKPRGLLTIDRDLVRRIEDRERKLEDYSQRQWLRNWQPDDDTPVQ
jgi:hypothetical protein